jgi:hypothetical protein
LDARKKATKFKLVQISKLNHTAQGELVRLVCITGQTSPAMVWLPKKRRRQDLRGLLHQGEDKVFRKQVKGKRRSACPR